MTSRLRCTSRNLWRNRSLVVEAAKALTLASIAIRLLPFRKVMDAAGAENPRAPRHAGDASAEISRVRWAIDACARRLPWRIVCFQKGLALHKLLQRRGISTTLHYGVAQDSERGLTAHVWVTHRGEAIIGGDEAVGYTCLASYPSVAQH